MSSQVLARAQTFVNAVGRVFGAIGMAVLVAMMLLTGVDVFLRYAFNRPIWGATEVTEFMILTLAFATIVWCTVGKAHIKVDLLSEHIPSTAKTILDVLFYLLYLVLYLFIAWRSFLEALAIRPTSIFAGEKSTTLDMPLYPFYILITVACGLIALMLLIYIVQGIAQVVKRWT